MAMAPGTTSIGIADESDKKMMSVLEMDDLNDFLKQADMANREFASEREQYVMLDEAGTEVRPDTREHVSWEDQPKAGDTFVFKELSVPRRPAWDETTTPEELDAQETESFLDWRRSIAAREEQLMQNDHARMTPFEKNLEVWRQLWRVLERCSCVLQIVDARNPLFYLSSDLRSYAVEELGKPMILLVNKSDYLSEKQRKLWNEYFKEKGWDHLFFSAWHEQEKLDNAAAMERKQSKRESCETIDDLEKANPFNKPKESKPTSRENIGIQSPLSREELLNWLSSFAVEHNCKPDPRFNNCVQFGMVGFPNVGKSSVINVLVGSSKHSHGVSRVGVASQPGKTKHFQTLFLPDRDDMMLCDCPGLVFPSFVSSIADLIAAGVYPISQMRDYRPVIELVCQRIPREILNAQYGIQMPIPKDLGNRDVVAPPTADELLTTYCVARSMLAASSGVPDYQRASRVVIKDYTDGKLLYCHTPPEANKEDFQRETIVVALSRTQKLNEKLGAVLEKQKQKPKELTEDSDSADNIAMESSFGDDLVDLDILELMEGAGISEEKPNGGKRGKKHKSMKKWGKKGRKDRNKDPYGCHSTPDEMLDPSATTPGVIVKAGKYGKRGYTRPTNYAGAKGVAEFENDCV
eukprot:CAMPEP_0178930054 /NCGR_PEP_ID=MMETSP0786-20121207/20998_1 /TAXON_ID=186022 /ORGANISM="Thalassionema frauenfeldii, Strain CCMP 1798" /LENGTH=635 /DNA_ID=CAMNT_0020606491 /DNA_START=162 /DNA_END=2069 /DNA_ORIENTATION=-